MYTMIFTWEIPEGKSLEIVSKSMGDIFCYSGFAHLRCFRCSDIVVVQRTMFFNQKYKKKYENSK